VYQNAAFSHWRALSGAKHLEFISDKNLILPVKSVALDAVYQRHSTGATINSDVLVEKTKVEWTEVAEAIRRARDGGDKHYKDVLLLREEDAQAVSLPHQPAL
jgi:hypothetical protein